MKTRGWSEKTVSLTLTVPEELARGIEELAKLKGLSTEVLLRDWVEAGLERDELRFERLLLFAEFSEELDQKSRALLKRIGNHYFDESNDGPRDLDPFMVKSRSQNHLYGLNSRSTAAGK